MNEATVTPLWTIDERLAALPLITVQVDLPFLSLSLSLVSQSARLIVMADVSCAIQDLQLFLKEALSQLSFTAFIHGNVTEEQAREWTAQVEAALNTKPTKFNIPLKRCVMLKKGTNRLFSLKCNR